MRRAEMEKLPFSWAPSYLGHGKNTHKAGEGCREKRNLWKRAIWGEPGSPQCVPSRGWFRREAFLDTSHWKTATTLGHGNFQRDSLVSALVCFHLILNQRESLYFGCHSLETPQTLADLSFQQRMTSGVELDFNMLLLSIHLIATLCL